MAKIKMTAEFVADMLFRWSPNPVQIADARWHDDWNMITFEIDSADLPPDEDEVQVVIKEQSNRAGEKFRTMEFRAA